MSDPPTFITWDELPFYKKTFQTLSERALEMISTVKALSAQGFTIPTLLYLHASLDAVSSWSRPIDQEKTNREVFKAWVDEYLLPGSGLPCTSIDIYGARCGLLHNLTFASELSRQGVARELLFITVGHLVAQLQAHNDAEGRNVCIVVFSDYISAFYQAMIRFVEKMQNDGELLERVLRWSKDVAGTAMYIPEPR